MFEGVYTALVTPFRDPDGAVDEAALRELPDRQRAALLLRSNEGLAYNEIAEALGVSLSSVKSLIHRARERLQALLAEGRS